MSHSTRLFQRSVLLNVLFVIEAGSMFLLDIVLAAVLGLGARSDILYAAWSLPLIIGRGAFQSLTNSVIGLFNGDAQDSVIYSQTITVIGTVAMAAALLMSLTSRWWFPLSIPGASPETRVAGAPLAAILSWLIAFLAFAETQRAIYYRKDKNHIPSFARVAGALVSIALIAPSAREQNLMPAAYGLVAGAAAEMAIGFIGLARMGERFRFDWPPMTRLRLMTRVIGLPLLGQGVLISAGVAERAIASYLGPGAVTAVTYALRIFQMLERFVFRGFVISTIQAYTSGVMGNWRRDMRLLILISVPIMVVFAVLPVPMITIVFERGRFTAESTEMVALALQAYALAIPIVALNRIPYALAFAQTKSRELLIYAIIFSIILIATEFLLIAAGLTLQAFGLAYVLAMAMATLWLYPRVRVNEMRGMWATEEILQLVGVALITLSGTSTIVSILQHTLTGQDWAQWVILIIGGISSVLLLAFAAWVLRLPEAKQLAYLVRGGRY